MTTTIFTKEIYEAGLSSRGALNGKQLRCLGLNIRKLKKGWLRRMLGRSFPTEKIDRFLMLRNAHLADDPVEQHMAAIQQETP